MGAMADKLTAMVDCPDRYDIAFAYVRGIS